MRKIKGFSYDPEKDKEVIEHINRQQNSSKYILNLVRKDMNKQEDMIEELVKKYIKKHLGKIETLQNDNEVDIEGIMNILEMQ